MNILFKTKFGSHLYGTNTPKSDLDYKGIFVAPLDEIILGHSSSVVQDNSKKDKAFGERNEAGDIDIEYKELRQFIKDCLSGQTYALDMLFSPKDLWLNTSPEWEFIRKHRQKLLSKNVKPYIGYCRQQAGKYGLKGSRLGELLRTIEFLKAYKGKSPLSVALKKFTHSEFAYIDKVPTTRNGEDVIDVFLNVLGKKFQTNLRIENVLFSLETMNEKYGDRARLAMNNKGIDWKAISHAYRCCYQLIELANTHMIHFPLKEAEKLKQIKQGKLVYINIQDELYELMQKAIQAVEESTLPDRAHKEFWDEFIIKVYKNEKI